jgi:hypothetical protein
MQTLHAAASSTLVAAAARDSAWVSSYLARAAPRSESATTWLQRRKLRLKAKPDSSLSWCSFKRCNRAR